MAGQARGEQQACGSGGPGKGIGRRDSEQHGLQELREGYCGCDAPDYAHASQGYALQGETAGELSGAGSEGGPDADFTGPAGDRVRNYTVNADDAEQQRHASGERQQHHHE